MLKRNIIITGGTDGIGLALTRQLIEKDQRVFIIGRNASKGEAVLNSIKSPNLEFFQCDLSELSEVRKILVSLNNLKNIDRFKNGTFLSEIATLFRQNSEAIVGARGSIR